MEKFEFPAEAKHYLLLQRPYYQSGNELIKNIFWKLNLRNVYLRHLLPYLDRNTVDDLSNKYYNEIKDEFDSVEPFLPASPENILDIGCGLGGINVAIDRFYNHEPDFYLLDKDEVSEVYYGFDEHPAVYNSLEATEEFLGENGISESQVNTVDVSYEGYPLDKEFDLIISLFSWGFHYPLETYLKEVKRTLASDGVLIIDIRKETDGMDTIKNEFKDFQIIGKRRNNRVPKDRICIYG